MYGTASHRFTEGGSPATCEVPGALVPASAPSRFCRLAPVCAACALLLSEGAAVLIDVSKNPPPRLTCASLVLWEGGNSVRQVGAAAQEQARGGRLNYGSSSSVIVCPESAVLLG